MLKRCSGGKPKFPMGHILIALGIGIISAYIVPHYILIALFAIVLIAAGIHCIRKK